MSTFHFRGYTSAPLLGRISLGKSFDELVGQGKALATSTQSCVRTTALDLNGDAFSRSDASGGYWVDDADFNGVADQQEDWGKTVVHLVMDTDEDGKVDWVTTYGSMS